MKKIRLGGKYGTNKFTSVDDEDFEELNKYRWSLGKSGREHQGYPLRRRKIHENKHLPLTIRMHRQILNFPPFPAKEIDHINGDTLDNRRCNLRTCSHKENCRNSLAYKSKKWSNYKGVDYEEKRPCVKKWRAKIYKDGKHYHLGNFHTEFEAAKAYDKKAKELFGKFAKLNFKENE